MTTQVMHRSARGSIPRERRKRSLLARIWHYRWQYISLLPTFALLVVFSYYPPLSAIYHSFFVWNGLKKVYYGLGNFKDMLDDEWLIRSVGHMGQLAAFNIVVGTLLMPITVAELVYSIRNQKASYLYRLLLITPAVVPGIVILLLWQFIYDPSAGLLNQVLDLVGLSNFRQGWLGDPKLALRCLMFMGFPWISGVSVLIYLAGLQGISGDVIDAAKVDGASGLRRILVIDLPLIRGQIVLMLILAIIGNIQGYGAQLILTNGGPGDATLVPGLHMFQVAFSATKMGYACAIGFAMFIVILALTIVNRTFLGHIIEY